MRTWSIACAVFVLLLLIPAAIEYRLAHRTVPPGVQRAECFTPPPEAESDHDWLTRLGGRVNYADAQWQDHAFTSPDIAQGRNLKKYDKLELIDREHFHPWEMSQNPVLSQARTFVWEHWQKHKRAYLMLTLSSVDSTGTSHIFVEPDDTGRWRVYQRYLNRRELVDEPTAYSLVWVRRPSWDKPGVPVPQAQPPQPLTDEIEFHDVCGEDSGTL
jgi:hypothetical protein